MKILVTGAKGFIGQNLIERLKENKDYEILAYDKDCSLEDLKNFTKECDFIFHFAGVNRPEDDGEFIEGNLGLTAIILNYLKEHKNNCPVMLSSSIQAVLDNPYGISKRASEDVLISYEKETGAKAVIFRFTNIFGKWSRPNYNSVIATFSYNISRGIPIIINDPNIEMHLIYIDDVVDTMISLLNKDVYTLPTFLDVKPSYKVKLTYIAELLYSFKSSRENFSVPKLDDEFEKKLYSTYLSYLPTDKFAYDLKMNIDNRGSFTEFLKTIDRGQVSINISKPGITKGNHWHHTKNEKFLVVSGKGVIRFRKINTNEIIEYFVSDEKLQVVDIPPGYTHNIENLGTNDMVTIMWANEPFDKNKPDTIYEQVLLEKKDNLHKKKSILILGASGMAGHTISLYLKSKNYDVTTLTMAPFFIEPNIVLDVRDILELKKVIIEGNYDVIINAIGILNEPSNENFEKAMYINSFIPNYLVTITKNMKTKIIHMSTDAVFSGNRGNYLENDKTDSETNYGISKAWGEILNTKHLTFRNSIIGPDINQNGVSFFNWFMKQKGEVNGYTQTLWTGVTTLTLAKAMEKAIEENLIGIYHLVNNEVISKYELLVLFNKYFRDNKIIINKVSGPSVNFSLLNTRKDFSFVIPSYEQMIIEMKEWIEEHIDLYPHYQKENIL